MPVLGHISGCMFILLVYFIGFFGLKWAQQCHGTWQTLQDVPVAMVLARESCERRAVCSPCGNCSR